MIAYEFVPLADRRFVSVAVDLTGFEATVDRDETDVVAEAITADLPLEGAVVRVSYTATEETHRRVDVAALTGFLEEAGVEKIYGGIHWVPVRESRARVEGVDEQLDPLAAVAAWCEANAVDHEPGFALRSLTKSYLEAA